MKNLKSITFSQQVKPFVTIVVYIIFVVVSFMNIIKIESIPVRLFFILIILIILSLALWSEYIKYLYRKAIKTIAFELNPEKALDIFNELLKKDIFHSYQNEKYIFDTLYYVDQQEYQKCLDLINEKHDFFHANIDQLLIYHYTNFYCSYMLGDNETATSEYQKMRRMKDTKVKGAKVSPLYNWEFIDATYQLAKKDYRQSFNTFKTVNTAYMNPREIIQYYYQFSIASSKVKDKNKQQECQQAIKGYNGSSITCQRGVNNENV